MPEAVPTGGGADDAPEDGFVPLVGGPVSRAELRAEKAGALAGLLERGFPFATLVRLWRFPDRANGRPGADGVVFDVEVELSQRPAHDIRRVERIAAAFSPTDDARPEPLALRADFPLVPHLNLTAFEFPRSLCLSDQPYADERLSWTPARFIESVRQWLSFTAAGRLHRDDQALEPLLGGMYGKIILPADLFVGGKPGGEPLRCTARQPGNPGDPDLIIMAEREADHPARSGDQTLPLVAIPLGVGKPLTHGVIRREPATLRDLHALLTEAGLDLLQDLRERLTVWAGDPAMLARKPIFVVALPKQRDADGPIETVETWAFLVDKTLDELRVSVGTHAQEGQYRGVLLVPDGGKRGDDVPVELLLPYTTLSRERAAACNGLPAADGRAVAAVGLGSLGSQVFDNLYRAGFGQWTLIDDDHLLPHNLARNELHGNALGFAKVAALAVNANATIAGPPVAVPLVADILSPGDKADEVDAACAGADLLLDMSASVSVARHLARDRDGARARRVSLFLNPSGTDLVLLAEDAGRRHRLDALEMQYYRALTAVPALAGHLDSPDGRLRYGRSCRDVSVTLPQDLVALHAAVGSRALRATLATPHAAMRVWRSRDDLTVSCVSIPVYPVETERRGDWTIVTDGWLLDRVRDLRAARLPVETGGVLLGSFDTARRIAYIADLLPSPPDSVEREDLYIRGSRGLKDAVAGASAATAGWLRYVGEWHSHPPGYPASASVDDRKLFGWLGDLMDQEGLPPLMLICGEGEHRWYLGEMPPTMGGAPR